ncbi:hypothetical protein CLOM_g5074 [Closterium sp. NIES-68]|nr:hypothetical protein CLOM_g5074 [Closterium sp. NIES-68]GJP64528.1 hypothetical protein CLOP_g21504 [Closterium sp. NIES-67]
MGGADDSTATDAATGQESRRHAQSRRFAILLAGHSSPYSQQRYGDYNGMFLALLGGNGARGDADKGGKGGGAEEGGEDAGGGEGEQWDVYAVVDGEFPSDEVLAEVEAVVVTGSKHDAHADDPWVVRLCAVLQRLHQRKTKILGVCFGHQVVGRALGGRTGRAAVGWELGIKQVQCSADVTSLPYAAGLPPSFHILEIHQDQVLELPPGAVLLGSSPGTPIEMFAMGEHVLCMQGHPEFTKDVVEDLVVNRTKDGVIPEAVAAEALKSLEMYNENIKELRTLCNSFLRS